MHAFFRASVLLLSLLAATAGRAGPPASACASLFSLTPLEGSAPQALLSAMHELALFKLSIDELPVDGSSKAIAIQAFQLKARQIAERVGPDFARLFAEQLRLLREGKPAQDQAIETEKKQKAARREKEALDLKFLTRIRAHEKIEVVGPWLDDSRMIAVLEDGLRVYDFNTQEFIPHPVVDTIRFSGLLEGRLRQLTLSPDKKTLVMSRSAGAIEAFDLDSGNHTELPIRIKGFEERRFIFSQDSGALFVSGAKGEAFVYSFARQKLVLARSTHSGSRGQGIILSPDGHWAFFIRGENEQILYDIKNGVEKPLPPRANGQELAIWDAVFSSDSRTISIADRDEIVDLDVHSFRYRASRFEGYGENFILSGDRKYLVITHDMNEWSEATVPVQLFDFASGKEIPLDFTGMKFARPENFMLSATGDALFFTDGKINETDPTFDRTSMNLYRLIFASHQVDHYQQNSETPYLYPVATTADGRYVIAKRRNGLIFEIH